MSRAYTNLRRLTTQVVNLTKSKPQPLARYCGFCWSPLGGGLSHTPPRQDLVQTHALKLTAGAAR